MAIAKSAAELLAIDDLKKETVEIPEWKTSVIVRELSAGEKEWIDSNTKKNGKTVSEVKDAKILAQICAFVVVDDNGDRVFSDAQVPFLAKKSGAAIERILAVTGRLSTVSAAEIQELAKNSESGPPSA